MENLPVLLSVLALAVAVFYGMNRLFPGKVAEIYPYQLRPHLLTAAERAFFAVLQEAAGDQFLVFAQVRVADVVQVIKGTEPWSRYFNRIKSKHVDFLLCEPKTVIPLAAIELDDSTHDRPERQARDRFLDQVFQAAGLPLIHVPVQRAYSVTELQHVLVSALSKRPEKHGSRP